MTTQDALDILRNLASILGVAGTILLITILIVGGLFFVRLFLVHGIEALKLFLPFLLQAWKTFLRSIPIKKPVLRVELLIEGLLFLIMLVSAVLLATHNVLPLHGKEESFTVLLYGAGFLFAVIIPVSINIAVRY